MTTTLIKAFGADQKLALAAREVMLSVRLESGDAWAFPYSYLVNMSYEKEANKMTLTFSSHRVLIHGQRLHLLYEALLGHAVQFVQVTAGHGILENECDIVSVVVEELKAEAENSPVAGHVDSPDMDL